MSPPMGSTTASGSIGGQAPVPLTESSEAYEALDVILAQVFNKDASACILALSQLDEFIKAGINVFHYSLNFPHYSLNFPME